MPRIPIIRLPKDSGGLATGDGPEMLPQEEAAGLRTLEERTARIDRELAVSQSWLAGLSRLAAAEDAPEGPSPDFMRSFLEETDRERALVLKPLPLDRQAPLEQELMVLREGFAERAATVEAEGMALSRRLALHRTLEGYRTGVVRDPGLYDDAAGRMRSLVGDLDLPEERRHPLDLHVRDALGNAAVDGLMREPERAERMLSAGLFDEALTEASKAIRLMEAQTFVARNRLLARERTLSELTAQAGLGAASDEAIAAAERDGVLTAAEVEHLRARNLEVAQAAALRESRVQRVASAVMLDPADPEDKAAADAYWEEVSEVYASDDAEAQREAELAFVTRIGVLPDGLRRKYQGALLSADPTIAVSGATAIDALNQLHLALVADIPAGQRRRATAIAQYAATDLPPERAIELAERDIETETAKPATRPTISGQRDIAANEPDVEPDDGSSATGDSKAPQQDETGLRQGAESPGAATIAGASAPQRPGSPTPSWEDLDALRGILETEGEEAFIEAAEEANLHPGRVRLFLDLLAARSEDEDRLHREVSKSYGRGYGLGVSLRIKNILQGEDRPEKRQEFLASHLWELSRDAPRVDQGIVDMGMGALGAPGARRSGKPTVRLRPGPGYRPNRKFITPEEFRKLPDKDTTDPQRVRTSQAGFDETFSAEFIRGVPASGNLGYLAKGLKDGSIKPDKVKPIQIVEWRGHVYTVDHRRLIAFRRAGVDIPFEKMRFEDLSKGKQRRIRGASYRNDNGSFIRNEATNEME